MHAVYKLVICLLSYIQNVNITISLYKAIVTVKQQKRSMPLSIDNLDKFEITRMKNKLGSSVKTREQAVKIRFFFNN